MKAKQKPQTTAAKIEAADNTYMHTKTNTNMHRCRYRETHTCKNRPNQRNFQLL